MLLRLLVEIERAKRDAGLIEHVSQIAQLGLKHVKCAGVHDCYPSRDFVGNPSHSDVEPPQFRRIDLNFNFLRLAVPQELDSVENRLVRVFGQAFEGNGLNSFRLDNLINRLLSDQVDSDLDSDQQLKQAQQQLLTPSEHESLKLDCSRGHSRSSEQSSNRTACRNG